MDGNRAGWALWPSQLPALTPPAFWSYPSTESWEDPPLSPAGCHLNPWTLTRSKKDFGGKNKKENNHNQPPILGWLLSRFLVKLGVVCSWVYHIELDIATSYLARPLEGDHAHSTDGAGPSGDMWSSLKWHHNLVAPSKSASHPPKR